MIKQPIRELQGYLRVISSKYNRIPELKPDGYFGPLTTQAVKEFQSQFQLEITGIVDFETWDQIYQTYLVIFHEQNPPGGHPAFPFPGKDLGINDKGGTVQFIQTMLNELSKEFKNIDTLMVVGTFDPATQANIMEIQKRSGLEQTGRVDAATWNALVRIYFVFTQDINEAMPLVQG